MNMRLRSWPVLALGGIVLAAAVFGGGLIAGKALEDPEDSPAVAQPNNFGSTLPRTGPFAAPDRDGGDDSLTRAGWSPYPGAAESGAAAADEARGFGYGGATVPAGYQGCEAPIGDVFSNGTIDPGAAGIAARLLGEGFQLLSLNLRAEGDCTDSGEPPSSGRPVLDTGWRHIETGVTVWVSQRIFDEPVANVRWETSANVVADGYFFTVNAWNNYYYYGTDDVKPAPDTADVEAAGIAPPNGVDPAIAPVVDLALAQLAPQVPAGCYYTQVEGSWADLAAFGVGDPRPAVPSGFTESSFNLFTYQAPDAGCADNGGEAPEGNSFWVQWSGDGGSSYLEVNVYKYEPYEGETWPGSLDDWGGSWTSNGYQFNVWGNTAGGGLGRDVILAMATALDPAFNAQCLITTTNLDAAGLAAIGISAPSAPDGFNLGRSNLLRRGVATGCPGAADYTSFELNWSFTNDSGGTLEVYGWINGNQSNTSDAWGYVHDYGIEWGDGNRNFSIWSNSPDGASTRDLVVAVALSIDPSLDIESFDDGGGVKPLPQPVAEDAAAR